MLNNGKFRIKLPKLTDVLAGTEGVAIHSGTFAALVKLIATHDVGSEGVANEHGTFTPSLKHVTTSLAGSEGLATESGTFGPVLKRVGDNFIGAKVKELGGFAVGLKAVACHFPGRYIPFISTGKITQLSKVVYAHGGCLFIFKGAPNKVITWTLVSGGGILKPFSGTTNSYGLAYLRYIPAGYSGSVQIEAVTS
jgi:hypothetical protein